MEANFRDAPQSKLISVKQVDQIEISIHAKSSPKDSVLLESNNRNLVKEQIIEEEKKQVKWENNDQQLEPVIEESQGLPFYPNERSIQTEKEDEKKEKRQQQKQIKAMLDQNLSQGVEFSAVNRKAANALPNKERKAIDLQRLEKIIQNRNPHKTDSEVSPMAAMRPINSLSSASYKQDNSSQ